MKRLANRPRILSEKELARCLTHQIKDLDNPCRYVIESTIGKRIKFYYIVEDDMFTFNSLEGASLFKRRKAALAILEFLKNREKRPNRSGHFRIVKVQKTKSGIRAAI